MCIEATEPQTEDEILEDQLVENCLREDLKPIEQARAFKALIDRRGCSIRQLAESLHVSNQSIVYALGLLDLPVGVQDDVEAGRLAPSTAYEANKARRPRGPAGDHRPGRRRGPEPGRGHRGRAREQRPIDQEQGEGQGGQAPQGDQPDVPGRGRQGNRRAQARARRRNRGSDARRSPRPGEGQEAGQGRGGLTMDEIPIAARKIKLSVPLKPDGLPSVPMDGPIGDLTLRLALEGSGFSVPARVNGKSYRRMLKAVAEKGAENVAVILQGDLAAPPGGGPVRLDSAGFQVIVKVPATSPAPAANAGD